MNNNDIDKQRLIDALLSSSGGKLSRDSINRAADGKDITPLVNSLSPEDREKLNRVMSDKESMEKLLKSPQAQLILKSVLKGGKNDGRTGR
mgnify:FL=1